LKKKIGIVFVLLSGLISPVMALTAIDDAGQEVTLSAPAKRIVSLAPHLTELAFAAGAGNRVVAVSTASNWPPIARTLPKVSDDRGVDFELLMKRKPDLVLLWKSGTPVQTIARIQALGIPVWQSEPGNFEQVAANIEGIGVLAGSPAKAKRVADVLRAQVRQLKAQQVGKAPVRVFYQVWSQPLMTLNRQHFISSLIGLCGGENIFAQADLLVPTVTMESVVAANPEVILSAQDSEQERVDFSMWKKFPQLAVTRNNGFVTIEGNLLSRPTPRALLAVSQLCTALDRVRVSGKK